MSTVKFGEQVLNIDGIPEGHMIVPEAEISRLRGVSNGYSLLKSRIPLDVDEADLGKLVEKGKRYDVLAAKLDKTAGELKTSQANLAKHSELPEGYSEERWNKFVQQENDSVFAEKIRGLTEKAYARVEKEMGVKIEVDHRFIPADILESFDPDDKDDEKKWYEIVDNENIEEEKLIKKSSEGAAPPTPSVGEPGAGTPPEPVPFSGIHQGGAEHRPQGDRVTEGGINVGRI
jgi:hypothetical protein